MSSYTSFKKLHRSQAVVPKNATADHTPFPVDLEVKVTVVVRSAVPRDERRRRLRELSQQLPAERTILGPTEFVEEYGAQEKDLRAVVEFAKAFDLEALEESRGRRCVVLRGTIANFDRAFGVKSVRYIIHGKEFRSYKQSVKVPEELEGVIQGVIGLDNQATERPMAAAKFPGPYTKRAALMEDYNFPTDASGKGQTIGIVALGGGYYASDLDEFRTQGQQVRNVELGGQTNCPSDPQAIEAYWEAMKEAYQGNAKPTLGDFDKTPRNSYENFQWTMELTSDLQNALRFAPGADAIVYFTQDDVQGKYDAFTTALIDPHAPSVLSCSWGSTEQSLAVNTMWQLDDVFEMAAFRGITICFSSGDRRDGALPNLPGEPPQPVSAHFPATSPHVLACGGTMPEHFGSLEEQVVWRESLGVVELGSGGGVSEIFYRPWWQSKEMLTQRTRRMGRGFPDVAGKADMETGYRIVVGGVEMPVGGTSSVAPLWAALITRLNEKLNTQVGFLTPLLYTDRKRFGASTVTITKGNNGAFSAHEGWDACTGWGTPDGEALLRALQP